MSNLTPIKHFEQKLALHSKTFQSVLPAHIAPKKFLRTIVGAVQHNPDLLQADQQSVINSCQKAAQDGLLLDGKEAALVVYKTKVGQNWIQKASYQPMIDGILKKLRNSGQLSTIAAINVHKNDLFSYNPAIDEVPNHNPDWFGDRGEFVGVYCVARLKDGSTAVEIMNLQEIEKIRKTSKQGSDKTTGEPAGIWKQWYDRKAQVACLKRICRRLPSSSDVDALIEADNREFEDYRNEEIDVTPEAQPSEKRGTKTSEAVANKSKSNNNDVYIDPKTGEEVPLDDPI